MVVIERKFHSTALCNQVILLGGTLVNLVVCVEGGGGAGLQSLNSTKRGLRGYVKVWSGTKRFIF